VALNAPRTIPYAFRVVEYDGAAWLFDDSSRTFICSFQPTIFMEPLYPLALTDEEHEEWYMSHPDADYFDARTIERLPSVPVPLWEDDITPDVEEKIAWDTAREAAQANHLL
jgi:hypothetical protein